MASFDLSAIYDGINQKFTLIPRANLLELRKSVLWIMGTLGTWDMFF